MSAQPTKIGRSNATAMIELFSEYPHRAWQMFAATVVP